MSKPTLGRLVFCIFFATAAVIGIDIASGGQYAPWVSVGLWLFPTIPFAGLLLQALSKLGVSAGILAWPALIIAIGFPTFWAYCLAIAKTGSWTWAALAAILGFVVAADIAGASIERSRAANRSTEPSEPGAAVVSATANAPASPETSPPMAQDAHGPQSEGSSR